MTMDQQEGKKATFGWVWVYKSSVVYSKDGFDETKYHKKQKTFKLVFCLLAN